MFFRLNLLFAFLTLLTQTQAQNYDESKVASYTLPPIHKTYGKKIVDNRKHWENFRRSEILGLFENNVYGEMPKGYDSIRFKIINEDFKAMNGKAHLKEVAVSVWNKSKSAEIHLTLFTPKNKKKSAVFLLINNRSKRNTDATRDTLSGFWPAEMLIDNGYAIAAFHVNDAAPDDKENYANGALRLYPEQLQSSEGMKAIGAWSWAASRMMDYFEKDKEIDKRNVFIVGHSRGGKAALWAGAQDHRFAMVFSNCSGNTGAALSRRRYGETIAKINTQFPHWFADNYKKYNDNESALPVDQHMLLALMAPRPLYVTNASKDLWADPTGTYQSLKKAEDVYAWYKKHSGLPMLPPKINVAVIKSFLGYHNREGIHDMTSYDWKNFIQFANYHLKKSSR